MMKARLTYIPLEVADQLDDFIITRDEQIMDAVKARARDYSMLSLLKLLYQLSCGSMNFSDLYANSKIRMKRSFLNYLKLCLDYDFVRKETVGPSVIYSITEKGRVMLNLFLQKSN
jgi:predicted transcriptional regulator